MAKTSFVDGDPSIGLQGTKVLAAFINKIFGLGGHRHTGKDEDGHAPLNMPKDLVMKNNAANPNYQLNISFYSDIQNAAAINITADITQHLDQGNEANSTWYHVHLIEKDDFTGYAARFSTSATTPILPAGYHYFAYAGAIYNSSGGNFIAICQTGLEVKCAPTLIATGNWAVYSEIGINQYVPVTAKEASGWGNAIGGSGCTFVRGYLASTSDGLGEQVVGGAEGLNQEADGNWRVALPTPQAFWGKSYAIGGTPIINYYLTGWRY